MNLFFLLQLRTWKQQSIGAQWVVCLYNQMSEPFKVRSEWGGKLSMIYCAAFSKWRVSQGDRSTASPDHNEWGRIVGRPCRADTVCLCHCVLCQRLDQVLVFAPRSLSLSELLRGKVIFLLPLAQSFMFSIKSVSREAHCVGRASTGLSPENIAKCITWL